MNPPELASEPPRSRIGAASNSAPHLRPLGWVMLGVDAMVEDGDCCKLWAYITNPKPEGLYWPIVGVSTLYPKVGNITGHTFGH